MIDRDQGADVNVETDVSVDFDEVDDVVEYVKKDESKEEISGDFGKNGAK